MEKKINEAGETAFQTTSYSPVGRMGQWLAKFFASAAKPYIAQQGEQNVIVPKHPLAGDTYTSLEPNKISVTPGAPGEPALIRNVLVQEAERTRKQRYRELEGMDEYPEISSAFDIFADDSTQKDTKGRRWAIETDSPIIKKEVENLFKTIRLDEHYWTIIRNIVKYGDCFTEDIIDENNPRLGIQRIKILDPNFIIRIENIYGYLTSFVQEIPVVGDFSAFGAQSSAMAKTQYIALDKNQITHFRLSTSDKKYYPYGRSMAASVIRTFKSLKMMEDAMLVYRLSRAPEKRVFYVNIANTPAQKVSTYLEKIKQKLRKDKMWNPSTGTIDERFNPLCLTGDTKIPLLDGRNISLLEIMNETKEGDTIEVWASDGNKLVPATATRPFISGTNAKILKVTLDNGEIVKCTPEHKFLLRDGTYKEAQHLLNTDSIFPFYSRMDKKGYLEVQDIPGNKFKKAYRVIAESIYGEENCKGRQIHHVNEKKQDNSIDNLVPLFAKDHMQLHGLSPITRAKNNGSCYRTEEYRKLRSKISKEHWETYIPSDAQRIKWKEHYSKVLMREEVIAKRKDWLLNYNKTKDKKGELNGNWRGGPVVLSCKYCNKNFETYKCLAEKKKFCSRECHFNSKVKSGKYAVKYFNHKIVSIEDAGIEPFVYDITVGTYHNFALTAGIVVKNSVDEDLFIPHRGDKETRVEVLPGAQNLGDIDDVKYFLDKILAGLKIPRDYVIENKDKGAERKANLSQLDAKFARTVIRVQQHFLEGLESIVRRHLAIRGMPTHLINNVKIRLPDPSDIFTKRKLEVDEAKARVVAALKGLQLIPDEVIYKEYFELDELEIEDYKAKIKTQMEEQAEMGMVMDPMGGAVGGGAGDEEGNPEGGESNAPGQAPNVGGRSGAIAQKQPGSAGMEAPANEALKYIRNALLNESDINKLKILKKIASSLESRVEVKK